MVQSRHRPRSQVLCGLMSRMLGGLLSSRASTLDFVMIQPLSSSWPRTVRRAVRSRARQRDEQGPSLPYASLPTPPIKRLDAIVRARSSRRATAIKESFDQIGQSAPAQRAFQEWRANDVRAADPGEVSNHLARFGMTKREPRLTFVGDPAIGLEGASGIPQSACHTMEPREIVLGPVSPRATNIDQPDHVFAHFFSPER